DNAIKLTTALYYTPAGRVIQARGIQPNVVVPNFKVNKSDQGMLSIDESDYDNHLANGGAKKEQKQLNTLKKLRKKEVALAQKDYQLYEALMMLKGMNALR
nr:peptidase S41 [Gammaproteobacteria bacterium]